MAPVAQGPRNFSAQQIERVDAHPQLILAANHNDQSKSKVRLAVLCASGCALDPSGTRVELSDRTTTLTRKLCPVVAATHPSIYGRDHCPVECPDFCS